MKLLAGLLVGIALGFGAGWAVFERPWGDNTQQRVEDAVAAEVQGDLRFVECSQLRSPPDTYSCTAYLDLGNNEAEPLGYRATLNGDTITVRPRP